MTTKVMLPQAHTMQALYASTSRPTFVLYNKQTRLHKGIMRTSRVSRETARIVRATSATHSPGPRRSLRTSRNVAQNGPSSLEQLNGLEPSTSTPSPRTASLKRRRKGSEDAAAQPGSKDGIVRHSPRKQPKLKDGTATRKARRQPAKHIKASNGDILTEPPPGWEEVYNTTVAMRKRVKAAVDTMGCESLAEESRSPRDKRLQTLIALMLSSQTKDPVTAAAIWNMQQNLPGGFCLKSLLEVEPSELNRLIQKVGFHNNKTKYIKAAAVIMQEQFNGDIPDTIEGLISLPGVGPKMAYLTMSAAWGRDEGIGVDVHVHRITNLWGWHKTSTPEQTRAELEAWLPREKWHEINWMLVGFGQTICLPVGRRCEECDLASKKLCPSAQSNNKSPVKKRVKQEIEIETVSGEVLKQEQMTIQSDDVGIKVEADLAEEGKVEVLASRTDVKLEDVANIV